MKAYVRSAILTVLLGVYSGAQVFAQGTAFTYQGRLNANGVPANGSYDLQFTVYDSAGGATVVAGPLTGSGVPVANGLFTVTLDFGTGVFTGPERWLQIAVRTNGAVTFTNLSPRQALTPSPYAVYAGTASNVVNGAVVKSLNNLRDNVTLAAGANVTLTPSGNTLTIASMGGGSNGIWSLNGGSAYYNGGNVGIGSSAPNHRLRVSGGPFWTTAFWQGALELDNASAIGWQANAAGNRFGIGQSSGGLYFFNSASDPGTTGSPANYLMTVTDNGNVGIGTPFPATSLTVHRSLYGIEHTDGTVRLDTYLDSRGGWLGTVSNHKLHFYVNDGLPSITIDTTRNVGIGTTAPATKLHLYHGPDSVSHRIETGGGVNAWTRLEFVNGNGQWDMGTSRSFNGDQLYFYRQGAPGIAFGIQPNGDAFLQGTMTCKVLTITGADLAEKFPSSDPQPEPGTVMEINPDRPGQLRISREAYCTRVAGVVSGARDLIAGAVLGNLPESKDSPPIALSGRVWLHGDATGAPIKPGDLLTTSDTPGHAMKVTDHAKAQGAILGKAMSSLKEGKGMVLVLVTLQ